MILSALIPLSLHHRQHRISQSVLSSYKEKGYCRNRIMPSLRLYALCCEINPRFISRRYSYGQSLNLLLTKLAKKKEAGNPLPANFPDAQNPEEPVLSNIHTAKLVQTPRLCRITSDRFSLSKTSATINHLASNSIRRLGSVSASSTMLL